VELKRRITLAETHDGVQSRQYRPEVRFHSRGLASALEHSLEEGRSYGYPVVRVGFDDSEPAWMWLDQLLRERSDWQNGLALAIEQVVGRGDGFVRTAFVDFLANV
jgi:hypothetical protein